MNLDLTKTIEELNAQLNILYEQEKEIKTTINKLSVMMGKPQPFNDADTTVLGGVNSIRPDQYFGKGFATAVKEYLRMKGNAASPQEIYDALKTGGFVFPKEWGAKFHLRNLSISMRKNTADFVYIQSNNSYGLWEFYPELKREKKKAKEVVDNIIAGKDTDKAIEDALNEEDSKN